MLTTWPLALAEVASIGDGTPLPSLEVAESGASDYGQSEARPERHHESYSSFLLAFKKESVSRAPDPVFCLLHAAAQWGC